MLYYIGIVMPQNMPYNFIRNTVVYHGSCRRGTENMGAMPPLAGFHAGFSHISGGDPAGDACRQWPVRRIQAEEYFVLHGVRAAIFYIILKGIYSPVFSCVNDIRPFLKSTSSKASLTISPARIASLEARSRIQRFLFPDAVEVSMDSSILRISSGL